MMREATLLGLPCVAACEWAYDRRAGASAPRPASLQVRLALLTVLPVLLFVGAFAALRSAFSDATFVESVGGFVGHLREQYGESVTGTGTPARPGLFVLSVLRTPSVPETALLLAGILLASRSRRGWGGAPLAYGVLPIAIFCFIDVQSTRYLLPHMPFLWVMILAPLRDLGSLPRVSRTLAVTILLALPAWRSTRWHTETWDGLRTRDHARKLADWIAKHTEGASAVVCWGGHVDVGLADRPAEILHLQPAVLSFLVRCALEERYARFPDFYPGEIPHAEWGERGSGRRVRDALPLAQYRVVYVLPWTRERDTRIARGVAFEIQRFSAVTYPGTSAEGGFVYGGEESGVARHQAGSLWCTRPDVEVYADGVLLGLVSEGGERFSCPEAPVQVTLVRTVSTLISAEGLLDLP